MTVTFALAIDASSPEPIWLVEYATSRVDAIQR